MRYIFSLITICFVLSLTSCREDFEFERSSGGLEFSRDTVYLDTVFTNIGSSTYTLKVYNRSDDDISIPTIQLADGLDSKYRMTVDGMHGNNGRIFNNVEMLANDSLYIFIETTANIADANPTDFLYTDQILFDSGSNLQKVELVTLIQDAVFLYPQLLDDQETYESIMIGEDSYYGFVLDENDPINGNEYIFTNEKPYVIYGLAAVGTGKTLNIEPGARIHFHADSAIIVASGGAILADGSLSETDARENEIIFEGDRLEPGFSDVPGQWFGIWLTPGSTGTFDHCTIENAQIGLYIQNNSGTVNVTNTQIYDCSNYGILAQTGTIYGENVVINTAGQATLACTLGGSYEFKQSTFNNNWASSQQVAVLVNNYFVDQNNQEFNFPLLKADFKNCIIFGSNQVELILDRSEDPSAVWTTPNFTKCQIKFNNTNNQFTNNPDYAFINDTSQIIKNGTPDFLSVNNNQLMIGELSSGNGFGDDVGVPVDLLGNPRPVSSIDLGAYQHTIFED